MDTHFLNILYNVAGLKAIFTTLGHSLWIGAIMALLAGLIIILTNKSGSLLRYQLLTGLLLIFSCSMLYIFFNTFSNDNTNPAIVNGLIVQDQSIAQQIKNAEEQEFSFTTLISFIERNSDTIVSLWLIIICFKSIQLIAGMHALRNLKKRNILEATEHWNDRMKVLAAKIGITKSVQLFQSSLAKIPMVIGHIKPVILFPVGILNALPPNEIEAILLHELAHIRRNDFLINLLQQFTEILFFFNPAVLWVSSLIKNERENCCDDIAIAVTQDKKIFINALVAFQEYDATLSYAATFPGTKNHLLNRVKRIITNNNKTLSNMEKLILASGIIIMSIAAFSFSPNVTKNKKDIAGIQNTTGEAIGNKFKLENTPIILPQYNPDNNISYLNKLTGDTSTKLHYIGVIDGKKIELSEENNVLKELYVDGKKIPEDQFPQYNSLVEKARTNMKKDKEKLAMEAEQQMKENIEKSATDAEQLTNTIEQLDAMKEKQQMKDNTEKSIIDAEELTQMKERLDAMKEAQEMKEQSENMNDDFSRQQEVLKLKLEQLQNESSIKSKNDQEMLKAQSEKYMIQSKKEQEMLKAASKDYMIKSKKDQEMLKAASENFMMKNKKEQEMMKAQPEKMKTEMIKQQKRLLEKQIEFEKQAEKMKLQQEKLNEMMKDTLRLKKMKEMEPAVYPNPVTSVVPEIAASTEHSVKSKVSTRTVTSVKSSAIITPVTSVSAISSVSVQPAVTAVPAFSASPIVYHTSNTTTNAIIRDLEKANLISTRSNVSFRLSNDELIVNGVKQPGAVHQKILKNYVTKPGQTFSLSYSNHE